MVKPIYLSAPMRGVPDRNRPLFKKWSKFLWDEGFRVHNPVWIESDLIKIKDCAPVPVGDIFAAELPLLATESTALLVIGKGWRESRGCVAEVATALASDVPAFGLSQHIPGLWRQLEFDTERGSYRDGCFDTSELLRHLRGLGK